MARAEPKLEDRRVRDQVFLNILGILIREGKVVRDFKISGQRIIVPFKPRGQDGKETESET